MEKLEDCIAFLLSKASQKAIQLTKQALQPYRVTPTQFDVLHLLWEKDGQSSTELGERLQLDGATMTGILDRLTQRGLIKRVPSPHDRRMNLIYLTAEGKELEVPLNQKIDEMNQEVLSSFTKSESQLLKQMLATIGEIKSE